MFDCGRSAVTYVLSTRRRALNVNKFKLSKI